MADKTANPADSRAKTLARAHKDKNEAGSLGSAAEPREWIMSKKLKELAEGKSDTELATLIKNSANQIWLAGLGAFAKAQEEGTKVFETLIKEGEAVQERAKKSADDKISEVKKQATGSWDKLEQVFEERVARALHSLNVPTRKDIEHLSKRVSELTHEVKTLSAELEQRKTPPKVVAAAK
jgi:poly(hydroxyalkanoate) granule-associated protein